MSARVKFFIGVVLFVAALYLWAELLADVGVGR